jgi:hypothetical protein
MGIGEAERGRRGICKGKSRCNGRSRRSAEKGKEDVRYPSAAVRKNETEQQRLVTVRIKSYKRGRVVDGQKSMARTRQHLRMMQAQKAYSDMKTCSGETSQLSQHRRRLGQR